MKIPAVFAVVPFSGPYSTIWSGISAACHDLRFKCDRGDTLSPFGGFVMEQICASIAEADIVVGEMSDRNPNVFYEMGYAHALGKRTILLAASGDDLASDTRGRRHLLHQGNPDTARRKLFEALSELAAQRVEPEVPNAKTLYEWPNETARPPRFTWTCHKEERHLQIDLEGGQRVIDYPCLGGLIAITDTDQLWNHRRGWAIMKFPLPTSLSENDVLHLFLEGRCNGSGQLEFAGDGGWIEHGTRFVKLWRDQLIDIGTTSVWAQWRFPPVIVRPEPSYDLKIGANVYLLTKMEKGTVFLKKIRLVLRKDTQSGNAPDVSRSTSGGLSK